MAAHNLDPTDLGILKLLQKDASLTNKEIAEKLDLSEQTVKNQLSAALKHLRQSLGGLASLAFLLWWLS